MSQTLPTTPFGRRPLSLAMMAAQAAAKACPEEAVSHKWRTFRHLTEAKQRLGLGDRALAVLSALLSFHPETALTPGPGLVVFPSNRELSVRAHGPSPTTLRRALSQLVETGLVIRRDSPNGKRYARRGEGGQIEQAFGFDLSPLVARAAEFEALAAEVRAAAKARALLREEISLLRRDIGKIVAFARETGLSGAWDGIEAQLRGAGAMPPRSAGHAVLAETAEGLRALREAVDKCLAESIEFPKTGASESQAGCHHQSSKPESSQNLELGLRGDRTEAVEERASTIVPANRALPLRLVLEACPEMALYARHGIGGWRDFLGAAAVARASLRIAPPAWDAAVAAMGEEQAAVVVAGILQRGPAIAAPGAYLRDLAGKARAGGFSVWPMVMALWRVRQGMTGRESDQTPVPTPLPSSALNSRFKPAARHP
ncbi:replication initiation protein RepC [Methylobacterium currus]|uniref:Replication initiation protein RepC n=1 Tax=Methylobacterium currus TaxID=2051553 RepID=A0A2R4WNU7_9HYPH|nr:plasmid replication protein RepC [Methylobacterium currus]AWB23234.1 replication initiation protein RepC [Methylobacterium currus]